MPYALNIKAGVKRKIIDGEWADQTLNVYVVSKYHLNEKGKWKADKFALAGKADFEDIGNTFKGGAPWRTSSGMSGNGPAYNSRNGKLHFFNSGQIILIVLTTEGFLGSEPSYPRTHSLMFEVP